MTEGDMRFTAQEYGTLMNWFMASDPWPINDLEHERMEEMLNEEAKARGYDGWVHAYHEWGYGDD